MDSLARGKSLASGYSKKKLENGLSCAWEKLYFIKYYEAFPLEQFHAIDKREITEENVKR